MLWVAACNALALLEQVDELSHPSRGGIGGAEVLGSLLGPFPRGPDGQGGNGTRDGALLRGGRPEQALGCVRDLGGRGGLRRVAAHHSSDPPWMSRKSPRGGLDFGMD